MDTIRRNPLYVARTTSSQLAAISARVARAQERAITGLAVEKPSDAPGQWSKIHALSSGKADQQTYQAGMDRAEDVLDTADQALGSASNLIARVKELAIQFSNGTYSDADRAAAADQVAGMKTELVTIANTRIGDRSVFAGDAYDGAAFDASGAYTGAGATSAIRIAAGEDMVVAYDGSAVFQGGVDAFGVLDDLQAALTANDTTAVAATLDPLDAVHDQIVGAWEDVGFSQTRIDDARATSENLAALLDERLTSAVGADPVAAYQEFGALKTSYEAALQVTAAASSSNLFEFLR